MKRKMGHMLLALMCAFTTMHLILGAMILFKAHMIVRAVICLLAALWFWGQTLAHGKLSKAAKASSIPEVPEVQSVHCPPHQWLYENGTWSCKRCPMVPG
jgi:hypothetical protein